MQTFAGKRNYGGSLLSHTADFKKILSSEVVNVFCNSCLLKIDFPCLYKDNCLTIRNAVFINTMQLISFIKKHVVFFLMALARLDQLI